MQVSGLRYLPVEHINVTLDEDVQDDNQPQDYDQYETNSMDKECPEHEFWSGCINCEGSCENPNPTVSLWP